MNMNVSFAGNVTYPRAVELRKTLESTPAHMLLLETDSPYLSPQKRRGCGFEVFDNMYASVGSHPHNAGALDDDAMAQLHTMGAHPLYRLVPVGVEGRIVEVAM